MDSKINFLECYNFYGALYDGFNLKVFMLHEQ